MCSLHCPGFPECSPTSPKPVCLIGTDPSGHVRQLPSVSHCCCDPCLKGSPQSALNLLGFGQPSFHWRFSFFLPASSIACLQNSIPLSMLALAIPSPGHRGCHWDCSWGLAALMEGRSETGLVHSRNLKQVERRVGSPGGEGLVLGTREVGRLEEANLATLAARASCHLAMWPSGDLLLLGLVRKAGALVRGRYFGRTPSICLELPWPHVILGAQRMSLQDPQARAKVGTEATAEAFWKWKELPGRERSLQGAGDISCCSASPAPLLLPGPRGTKRPTPI